MSPEKVRLDKERLGADGGMSLNVAADGFGGDCDHVLPCGVAGCKLEVQVDMIAFDRKAHVLKPAMTGRTFGDPAKLFDLREDPRHKQA